MTLVEDTDRQTVAKPPAAPAPWNDAYPSAPPRELAMPGDSIAFDADPFLPESEHQPAWILADRLFSRLALLWPHRLRLLGGTAAIVVIVFLALFLIPNQYTATAILNPPEMNPISGLSLLIGMKSGPASGLGSQVGDILGLSNPGETYVQTMQTCRVEDALIHRFDLRRVYRIGTLEKTRRRLEAESSFSVDRKSGLIRIEVTDRDPDRAAQMANAYSEELGKVDATLASSAGREEREYFEAQLQAAEQTLLEDTRQLGEYGKQNAALDVDSAGKGVADAIAMLEGQIVASEAALKGMRAIYTGENDNVRQMEAQIAELKRQLAELAGPKSSSNDTSAQQQAEPSLAHLWGTAPSYLDLAGKVKLQGAIVEALTEQYEIAKLREARRISDVQLLDPALPPEKKSGPHRALLALAAGIVFFFGMCTQLLMKDWWRNAAPDDPWKRVLEPRLASLRRGRQYRPQGERGMHA